MSALGQPFIILDTIDSTNNYAMGQVHAQLTKHGATYFALDQTAGKGQRNKTWSSAPGQNIMMSLVIMPEGLPTHRVFFLSAAVAVAVHEFFAKYAGDETSIKWPNDLYWRDRKAGGILIENGIRGSDWAFSIVGIGININQTAFPETVSKAVSLKQITGQNFETIELARELCAIIENKYEMLLAGAFEAVLKAYRELLFKKGERVRLKKQNGVFEAIINDVTDEGKLLVRAGDLVQEFSVGEVEMLPDA